MFFVKFPVWKILGRWIDILNNRHWDTVKALWISIYIVLWSLPATFFCHFGSRIFIYLPEAIVLTLQVFRRILEFEETSWVPFFLTVTELINCFCHRILNILLLFCSVAMVRSIENTSTSFKTVSWDCFAHFCQLCNPSLHICTSQIIKVKQKFHHSR